MKTQTEVGNPEVDFSMEAARQPELLAVHPEIERIERMGRLHDTLTHDRFKDNITICTFNMLETGKANAFAIDEDPDLIRINNPVQTEPEYRSRFGEDLTNRAWREETKIDELLRDDSPKKQQLLYELDEESGVVVPKKKVLAVIFGLPMGGMDSKGLHATDLQRPIKDMLWFFWAQQQSNPEFILGVLTHDGNKSGLMLCKKGEQSQTIDTRQWDRVGGEDGVSRTYVLPAMEASGMVYTDIDLTCAKKREKETNEQYQQKITTKYEQRVAKAVEALYSPGPDEYVN
jgi:hypothetical protein